jgi:signal transduction histidine kinase
LPYVFDQFTQVEVSSRDTPGEVGLGLTIARHLIELHHHPIGVARIEGQGATFTIRLPLINATKLDSNASA